MTKRTTFEAHGKSWIVLPYTGFRELGIATEPEVPRVAVPLSASIAEAIGPALELVREQDDTLSAMNVPAALRLLAKMKGVAREDADGVQYEDRLAFPFVLFRGERQEEAGILPTAYRGLERFSPEMVPGVLRRRLARERAASRRMRMACALQGHWLSEAQGKAAARHYGAPSPLLDFSFDPRVAAFFAHPGRPSGAPASQESQPRGILYCFRFALLQAFMEVQGWKPLPDGSIEIRFYNTNPVWTVPYLASDRNGGLVQAQCHIFIPPHVAAEQPAIRIVSVPAIRRIRAQQSAFIEIRLRDPGDFFTAMFLWYLIDFLCEKYCFLHGPQPYEDLSIGLSHSALFPPDGFAVGLAGRSLRHWRD
jgi:hypothetical protein